jgi:co-chaperonin GroES (HSP10)|tara:strand:+ start:39555 stop:40085 length:531 start_codon:yes stop_codon:yes gene_type:complete
MIKAAGKKVFIKPHESKTVTSNGLHVPDASIKIPSTGEVVSVGEMVTTLKVGDQVRFSVTGMTEAFTHEDEEYFYLHRDKDVLYKIEDGKPVPLYSTILVKRDEVEEKTETGLFVPEAVRQGMSTNTGVVYVHGFDCDFVREGMKVIIPERGVNVEIDDVEYAFFRDEGDILAIID